MAFSGSGRIYLQSRHLGGLARWLSPFCRWRYGDEIVEIQVRERGVFSLAVVRLDPGDTFVSEAGALYRGEAGNIDVDVTTKSRGQGGLLAV